MTSVTSQRALPVRSRALRDSAPVGFSAAEFDDEGRWVGVCPECSTDHDGHEPRTIGGDLRCLRAQAAAIGADHLVDQADAGLRDLASRRDETLRSQGLIP